MGDGNCVGSQAPSIANFRESRHDDRLKLQFAFPVCGDRFPSSASRADFDRDLAEMAGLTDMSWAAWPDAGAGGAGAYSNERLEGLPCNYEASFS